MILPKRTTLQREQEDKTNRIKNYRKKEAILNLEEAWRNYSLKRLHDEEQATNSLLSHITITSMVKRVANTFYKSHKNNSRVSYEDFYSVSFEKAWNIISDYSWSSHYFLYEHLNRGLHTACIDLLRSEGLTKSRRNRNTSFHKAKGLNTQDRIEFERLEIKNPVQFEALLNVRIIREMDDQEEKVAQLLLLDTDITLEEICSELNLKWRPQASRIKDKVLKKLSDL
ncbi:hypothetical protein V1502_08140 [Bacillus sp. SCS-153A]|uniref:hypothetical protein n=1 Tax=Rossellomorea sedimentorum TaxID=3115294 RepID=UPI003905F75E